MDFRRLNAPPQVNSPTHYPRVRTRGVHENSIIGSFRFDNGVAKRRGPDTVFVCAGGFSGQMTLPQAWTDRREPPGPGRLSAGGLAALGAATRAVQGR